MKKEKMDKSLIIIIMLGGGVGPFVNSNNPVFFAWGILALAVSLVLAVKVLYEELILKKKGNYVAKEYEEFDLGSKFAIIQLLVLMCLSISYLLLVLVSKQNVIITAICYILMLITILMGAYEIVMRCKKSSAMNKNQ
jgi:hypothetical protein